MGPGAHPRSRGENLTTPGGIQQTRGSSPLTRGKLPVPPDPVPDQRLIPAHAGKTQSPCRTPHMQRAHPRSRGENAWFASDNTLMRGSSPLTRGKPDLSEVGGALRRLIPAHAGKTSQPTKPRPHLPAHPRSRGENDHLDCPAHHELGSSPLTRGKHGDEGEEAGGEGLIPAHAGKTPAVGVWFSQAGAHPRSRGENGPPPTASSTPTRLIPAHAGKTTRRCRAADRSAAHPRSRGENRAG